MAVKRKPTMEDYTKWTPAQQQAWQALGAFMLRLRLEGKLPARRAA